MINRKKFIPVILIGLIGSLGSNCKQEKTTEAEFITAEILTTDMGRRVNGLQDLLHFSTLQQLNNCQQDCAKIKEAVDVSEKEVAAMEALLLDRIGGVKPPPPPCPCETGNCLWESPALFSYFVDVKQFGGLPEVTLQTINGEIISSSADAEVEYSPQGRQFAVVRLPQKELTDKTVKMVIAIGTNDPAEVLVHVK